MAKEKKGLENLPKVVNVDWDKVGNTELPKSAKGKSDFEPVIVDHVDIIYHNTKTAVEVLEKGRELMKEMTKKLVEAGVVVIVNDKEWKLGK